MQYLCLKEKLSKKCKKESREFLSISRLKTIVKKRCLCHKQNLDMF